ncbi:uncharacterized protein srxn1 isoform X2 [Nerophis ophidion]|uniref:uncharacterized protein srxn1 isoform X2 n=1 Tax=Nerophis ophidion TaxID=159077 RepID=UPI002ADF4EA4|nr:uncharacterized protein srxn1 isoform X2 [Nerophis ophidion]
MRGGVNSRCRGPDKQVSRQEQTSTLFLPSMCSGSKEKKGSTEVQGLVRLPHNTKILPQRIIYLYSTSRATIVQKAGDILDKSPSHRRANTDRQTTFTLIFTY